MKREKNKNSSLLFFLFAFLLVFVFVLMLVYFQNTKTVLENETNQRFKENNKQVALALDYRVDIQMERLQTISFTYQQYLNMNNPQGAQDYLETRAKKYMFRHLEMITPSQEEKWKEYTKLEPFQRSIKGYADVGYIDASLIDGKGVVLYSIPYIQNGEVKAILVGERTKEKVAEILDIDRFANQGKYIIVDKHGAIVTHNKNVEHLYQEDFYELFNGFDVKNKVEIMSQFQNDLKRHHSHELTYVDGETEMLMNYSPLDSVDWTFVSMVETNVLSRDTSLFMKQAMTIIACVETVLIILFILFIRNSRKYNKELEEIAYVDPVTKGNTIIKFEELYVLKMQDMTKQYAMITLDIDKFKIINDTFGKIEGDKTLKYIYDRLTPYMSENDVIARGQADVFYILKEFAGKDKLIQEFNSIIEEINQVGYKHKTEQYSYKLTVSAGIYIIDNHNIPLVTAVARSTVARKKKLDTNGGQINTCYFYSEEDRERLMKETEIINRMEPALSNQEFEVYLQPKMDSQTHKMKGAEALIRWNDSIKGIVYPNDFIPIFEKTGFIQKIDLYVFEKCCQLVKKWMEEGRELITISVNLSRFHFSNPDFLKEFIQIKDQYKVPASCFEMEITETIVCEDPVRLMEHIQKIHEAGFTCSLDDFGAGYSSLNILKNIPVDVIKLDRAFFKEGANEKGKVVIESIIDLAKRLDMKTVAEGVETFEQVNYLKDVSCDLIQGYFFSRPIPIHEFENKYLEG